ncbi:phytoene/squalene synthase family protein [Algoriphagus zhangzhouensis]|uniref:Phytoene/squalene synthetase n=1 Tax=Algoriphagus zhangzhouensis TaxID=1073327 RepID=A0A1M7ZBC5_9BACT|nr:phytoene/squalene synthase family protein [Algoriphagus zhangzhouensis]TDY46912.1 phytoene/squalene synthetase [Algoriphagus zhangzhouensis]SHO62129.1 Phytoene/squalene synthetase [Algoriphagus zhangzhouensis]
MDAKALYNQTSLECSRLITQRYSTSFTLGIKTLDKKYHMPIYAIYGFVRFADEIVDTFHDQDKEGLLEKFTADTFEAIEKGFSYNPVLQAFQMIVNEYDIDFELIKAFLHSMEMDLDFKKYNDSRYNEYIYGSAEVVGLMCLKVFCKGDSGMYNKLKEPARKLGAAFQKVNFLRDIKSDYEERGRVYFPGVDYRLFDLTIKKQIEEDIQRDFDDAQIGIEQLPEGAKLGVRVAYLYYQKLFDKIKSLSADVITKQRIRIPNSQKLSLLVGTFFETKLGIS